MLGEGHCEVKRRSGRMSLQHEGEKAFSSWGAWVQIPALPVCDLEQLKFGASVSPHRVWKGSRGLRLYGAGLGSLQQRNNGGLPGRAAEGPRGS